MTEPTEKTESEEKNSGINFLIFILFLSLTIATIKTVEFTYNYLKTSKETRELHSLQNEDSVIKNDALDLKKRIDGFNKKIDTVSQTKEKYPIDEPIPDKINPCKILAGKEAS
ncbi:MAG: hypothetical protein Q7U36_00930 [bacterium]|nr:hypothetical protein [bacterium]